MAQRGLMVVVVSLLFLSTTVAGCISLIPAREMMESLRAPPRIEMTEDKVNISHTFDSLEISELTAPITGQRTITMDDSAVQMQIYFRATMPTSGWTGDISNSIRYVDAKLLRPDGSVYWEQHVTKSKSPVDNFAEGPFEVGEWRLEIEARGIGIDIGGVAVKDDFIVIVTVRSECIRHPTETDCVIE